MASYFVVCPECHAAGVPFEFRVYEKPDPEKVYHCEIHQIDAEQIDERDVEAAQSKGPKEGPLGSAADKSPHRGHASRARS